MRRYTIDDLYPSMPWDEIDNVVFDVGNVLLTFSPAGILQEYVPERPDLYPALMNKVFRSPYWAMMDRGSATIEEAADLMVQAAPQLAPYIRRVMENWVQMKEIIPEGVDALKRCKAMGKKAYVLSNYGNAFDIVEKKYDFFRLFDGMAVSSRVKLTKPDLAIYRLLTDTYELDPARTLFIDDTPANIEAAMYCGWHGLCFNAPGRVSRFIR